MDVVDIITGATEKLVGGGGGRLMRHRGGGPPKEIRGKKGGV